MKLRHYLVFVAIGLLPIGLVLLFAGMWYATMMCVGAAGLLVSSAAMMVPDLPMQDRRRLRLDEQRAMQAALRKSVTIIVRKGRRK